MPVHQWNGRMITARTGARPKGALPLAGSRSVWFEAVPGMASADLAQISALRPSLCGLALDRPRIMGIVNVTPDSFSDGGTLASVNDAVARAWDISRSSDILDIGGESTRPGADFVTAQEEIRRTAPVIRAIRDAGITTPISIDTRKADVARAALLAGADMVNDVSAMTFDPEMAACVAEAGVPVCLMHAKGTPANMQDDPQYDDVLTEVLEYLTERVEVAQSVGIGRERIIVDPGIGFGKTLQHNVTLLRGLAAFHALGCPVLLGASRKGFIGSIGHAPIPSERSPGSVAVALHGAAQGVQILRVHDTADTRQALSLHLAIVESDGGEHT